MQGSDTWILQNVPNGYSPSRQHRAAFSQIDGQFADNQTEADDLDQPYTPGRDTCLATATISFLMYSAFFGNADKRN
jgi:hypothetical protein